MAGVSEDRAEALHRQGAGFARHLGVKPGTKRYNAVVYGTKRSGGWKPGREVKRGVRASVEYVERRRKKR